MTPDRLQALTRDYAGLRLAVIGDFCLDRYLEIDPARAELSIETGLPVHNVVRVRSQPGAAGTILNNLAALGIGRIFAVGCCGEDGEGFELKRALGEKPGVSLDYFFAHPARRTFTYVKPLVVRPDKPPEELNRLDIKNWTPTPAPLVDLLRRAILELSERVDAVIVMDQVDSAETGVVTSALLEELGRVAKANPQLPIVADSRRGLGGFPPLTFKMNDRELARLAGDAPGGGLEEIKAQAINLARSNRQPVFITLAERGIIGASAAGECVHAPALPLRGEIDVVGAGDSVTANLAASLAAGASLAQSLEIAMLAASLVIHQVGTTGTASVAQIRELLGAGVPSGPAVEPAAERGAG